jgi:hypothetical protein
MSWNRTLTLTLDVDAPYGRVLIGSLTDTSLLNQPPVHILGDAFPLRLQFARRATIPTDPAVGISPPTGSTIVYSGKASGATGDLLFFAADFEPVLDDDSEPIPGLFQGTLDLNTTELAAHLAASPTGPKTILGEVEIRNAANTERISLQFDLIARPQVYIGTEGVPTDANPPYPLPSALLIKTAQTLTSGELTQVRANLALGTMADQNASSVAITGGSIAGASVTGLPAPAGDDDAVTKQYVDTLFADGVKVPSGLDCSANPDYPASEAGDTYKVTVGGKIGGASGPAVEAGDLILCVVDSVSGDHATVGANFLITQTNLDQATESLLGSVRLATQAEAEVATNNTRAMTPLRTKQYVETLDRAFQSKINYLLSA